MKLSKQVSSLSLSKRLKELGIEEESAFVYVDTRKSWKKYNCPPVHEYCDFEFVPFWGIDEKDAECALVPNNPPYPNEGYNLSKPLPAYTTSELGEILPKYVPEHGNEYHGKVFVERAGDNWVVGVKQIGFEAMRFSDKTEANARARMIIYLAENNLLEVHE